MAESGPLTAAYTHAQKAADETRSVRWLEAAQEHRGAAAEFGRAARTTGDAEALRILKLLEDQHQRLAQIVSAQDSANDAESNDAHPKHVPPPSLKKDASSTHQTTALPPHPKTSSPLSPIRIDKDARSSSPSLARDIASRRGIPLSDHVSHPSAAAQARARQLSPESHRRSPPVGARKVPPSIVDSQPSLSRQTSRTESDDGFTKFYNSLTTGTMSKLSSVLAYAGLPLNVDDPPVEPQNTRRPSKRSAAADNDPNVKNIFSKAALNALEDEHRQRGTLGHGFGPAESFYVVPQSGGTTAYADIVKLQQPPQHHRSSSIGDHEEFVDASETPGPPSPKHSRRNTPHSVRSPFNARTQTMEELELENATLKNTLEQLASRLANFEAHAQDASMAFLTQSMIGQRPSSSGGQPRNTSGSSATSGGGSSEAALQEHVRQLEQRVERQAEDEQRLRDLASKQEKALRKWDKRFEVLNARAKEKKQAKQEREKASDAVDNTMVREQNTVPDETPL